MSGILSLFVILDSIKTALEQTHSQNIPIFEWSSVSFDKQFKSSNHHTDAKKVRELLSPPFTQPPLLWPEW